MKFIIKTLISTGFGMIGGWIGDFMGMGMSLILGFIFSIIGWYWAKFQLEKY